MSDYPNLTNYGYQIKAELGRNREGGRITWQAIALETGSAVAIKQFCFARTESSWSGYQAHSQEIEMLQDLNHPGIPKYLDSMETEDGFCLVQEYIAATPCADFRPLTIAEVKEIAGKTLDILIYLQQQTIPILHRDLSTSNILLAESLDVYLIDFGFACFDSQELSGSSVFRGTPGFIAPEQIIQPTKASDIYGLGVVLVCLLCQKDIAEVRTFTIADDPYQLDLQALVLDLELDLDPDFYGWLASIISAKVSQRFADALTAKQALKELDSALTWLSADADSAPIEESFSYPLRPKIVSLSAVTGVSAIATWGLSFAYGEVELTVVSVVIAILATMAIAVTQLGAVTIASSDPEAKIQALVLSTVVPLFLVSASGLIWGGSEAVIIAAAIIVAEVCLLAYYWGQLPSNSSKLLKGGLCLSAIALGIGAGLSV